MKTSTWYGLILAAGITTGGLIVPTTYAADGVAPRGRPFLRAHLLERAKERLGLSEEQTAQIKSALKADKANLASLLVRMHDARVALRAAIQAPDASEDSVRAASAQVAVVQADLAVARLRLYGKLSPILTAEQREKLNAFQARLDELLDGAISRIGERLAE